jgi:hypothetical protein
MLKKIIEECFADIKENADPNEGKRVFGHIWAALAGKRARFTDGELFLTWRALSNELAAIYNEWYDRTFTTDAFLQAQDPSMTMGESDEYDDAVLRIYKNANCTGLFAIKMGPPPTAKDAIGVFQEIDVVTGEQLYYQQAFEHGRRSGSAQRITSEQYETICYSMR